MQAFAEFPIPVLAIRSLADSHLLEDLRRVGRLGLWEADSITSSLAGLSARVGGVIIATTADPVDALAQAALAGAVGPYLVVTGSGASHYEERTLRRIGTVRRLDYSRLRPFVAQRSAMPLYCRDLSLMIDPLGQSVWTSKGRKRLAPTALAVLFYLAAARGAALSRDRLRVLVWPEGGGPRRYGQLLEYYLSQVRKALRAWRLPLKLRVIKDFGHALERFPADT